MPHIVLLGDSVFDNGAYVSGPDVVEQLRGLLPDGWRATLNAVDGSVASDVTQQMRALPADATHLVVSAGGNDALRESGLLQDSARSVAEVLIRIGDAADRFAQDYDAVADALAKRGLPAAVCTIYDPRFPDPLMRRAATTALTAFNDRITRAAFQRGFGVLDLRLICGEDADFANPIEPSIQGGAKIAAAIAAFAGLGGDAVCSKVFAG